MFELVKFKKEHLHPLLHQPENGYLQNWLDNGHASTMEDQKSSFTGMVKGKPAVCGGVIEMWTDRGFIWSVFNTEFKGNFLPVFRGIKHFITQYPCRRLEMAIACKNERAMVRARLLGFQIETPLAKKYLPDGSDCVLFAKIRGM